MLSAADQCVPARFHSLQKSVLHTDFSAIAIFYDQQRQPVSFITKNSQLVTLYRIEVQERKIMSHFTCFCNLHSTFTTSTSQVPWVTAKLECCREYWTGPQLSTTPQLQRHMCLCFEVGRNTSEFPFGI